jgi:hypothetical protein
MPIHYVTDSGAGGAKSGQTGHLSFAGKTKPAMDQISEESLL